MPKPDLILLALDEPSILNLMDRVLRAVKYETAIASDTQSLAKILTESAPSLVLISEKFHGHDGVKMARELQERFPTLPFLIYAEKLHSELIKGVFHLALGGCLTPPLSTDDIVDAVETALKNAHRVGDWLRKEVTRTTASLQKRAQISEAEHARLQAVFNNIHDSVMIINHQDIIILVNPAMCRSFALDPKTVLGKSLLDVIKHPDLLTLITRADTNDPYQYHEISFPDGRVGNAQLTSIREVGYAFTM